MRKGSAKTVHHKNGDMTAVCCVCFRRQREKAWHWSQTSVGLDYIAYICACCSAASLTTEESSVVEQKGGASNE